MINLVLNFDLDFMKKQFTSKLKFLAKSFRIFGQKNTDTQYNNTPDNMRVMKIQHS